MYNFLEISLKLETLFYKIIYMSMIASLIGIVILFIKQLLKKQISPKWITRIWLVFIISLIIPIQVKSNISIYNFLPVNLEKIEDITISNDKYNEDNNESIEVYASDIEKKETDNFNLIKSSDEFDFFKIVQLFPLLWIIIVITLIISYLLTYIVFEIKIQKCQMRDNTLNRILDKCKQKLHITKDIKLVKQNIIRMPSIFGIFKVRLLINDNILELSEKEKEYIFLHELSHYKRKDNILNILIMFLRCIYFFNPIILILLNKIKDDLEIATDEMAMQNESKENQKEYSKILVKLSTINSDKFLIQTMYLSENKKNLERRIDSMKLINKFKKRKIIITLISIAIIVLVVILFYTKSNNYMSKRDIQKLYNNASKYTNIHYVKEEKSANLDLSESYTIYEDYYCKDNIVYEKNTNENGEIFSISYTNYNDNEAITISNKEKTIYIYDISNVLEKNRNQLFKNKFLNLQSNFKNEKIYKSIYKYEGKEKINNIETYKVIHNIVSEFYKEDLIHWIDKDNGLILREEGIIYFYDESIDNHNQKFTRNYSYDFNIVTDEDIKRPNLAEYKDYTIIENINNSVFY